MCEKTYRRFLLLFLSGIICLIYMSLKEENQFTDKGEDALSASGAFESSREEYVYPSGEPIGIYVKTDGVMVIGTSAVTGENRETVYPCGDKIRQGDYITKINDSPVRSKREMIALLQDCGGEPVNITIRRKGEEEQVQVCPVKSAEGKYLLGLWVRDDISGIGTLTYVTADRFGALGHSINDTDTGELFSISDGAIYKAQILHIQKPGEKTPGRLEGVINYNSKNIVGRVQDNESYGINGVLTERGKTLSLAFSEAIPVAKREELHEGQAYLLSALSGEKAYYEVTITDINSDEGKTKGMQLEVIDRELLSLTGGIVQGMSGTPIIQDGKLIGAVTHVFVNDATRGYGIYIGDMME